MQSMGFEDESNSAEEYDNDLLFVDSIQAEAVIEKPQSEGVEFVVNMANSRLPVSARSLSPSVERGWHVLLTANRQVVPFKVDTGADANVISLPDLETVFGIPKSAIKPTKIRLKHYDKGYIALQGEIRLELSYNQSFPISVPFLVTKEKRERILGEKTSQQLGLIEKKFVPVMDPRFFPEIYAPAPLAVHEAVSYPQHRIPADLVDRFGRMAVLHFITLKPDAVPFQAPPRRVPYAIRDEVQAVILDMEANGIIRRVHPNER
jgi:hypothetical protein